MKAGLAETPTKEDFLSKRLEKGAIVGVDAQTISHDASVKLREALGKHNITLSIMNENLVDLIWKGRPVQEFKKVFHLPVTFSGRESKDKIASLCRYLKENNFFGFVVSALDEVGWLFNLRGSDISCNPNFFSYSLVTEDEAVLYCNTSMLTEDAKASLAHVTIKPYQSIFSDLQDIKAKVETLDGKKVLISGTCNAALVNKLGAENVISRPSPVMMEKAIKNEKEIEGLKNCHLRDAAALVKYFAWLESELAQGSSIDEVDGAERLEKFRSEQQYFKGPSFETISGSGPNGAIIHYKPERPSAAKITMDQLYLCDSGGQYMDGTTDVTRTLHFGTPTDQEKECFTRVLLGHIALDRAIFPTNTTGFTLDALARLSLWEAGLDYRHGTGHGVGHFLNVHEGPQSISYHIRSNETALRPGMTVTNEPGYYFDGHFGIRLENVLVVAEADTPNNFGGVKFLKFTNLTMVPMQTKLMKKELMTEKDIAWVNEHHHRCWERISPLLADDHLALEWLRRETQPISK